MLDLLKISLIIISIVLIFFVLIQNKNVTLNLSTMGGGMGEVKKRGPEKVLHVITIIVGCLFVLNCLAVLFLS